MKKTFRFFGMILAVVLMSVSLPACGDDDDEPAGAEYNDYFMEVTDVAGGGLSTQECSNLKASINADLTTYYWRGVEKTKAIYEFDSLLSTKNGRG